MINLKYKGIGDQLESIEEVKEEMVPDRVVVNSIESLYEFCDH